MPGGDLFSSWGESDTAGFNLRTSGALRGLKDRKSGGAGVGGTGPPMSCSLLIVLASALLPAGDYLVPPLTNFDLAPLFKAIITPKWFHCLVHNLLQTSV